MIQLTKQEELEAQEAMRLWRLHEYSTQELKDELELREQLLDPPSDDICEHGLEMGYCPVKDCEGSL